MSWWKIVFWIRMLSIVLFLVVSIKYNIQTFLAFILMVVSFYVLDRNILQETKSKSNSELESDPVPGVAIKEYTDSILTSVLDYDPEGSEVLDHFRAVQMSTECLFAKQARLWGCRDYRMHFTLEENVLQSVPMLIKFLAIGQYRHLDGFVFELGGADLGQDVSDFGEGVRRVLLSLSDADPANVHCMDLPYIDQKGWVFSFNKHPIFVTTFAPCYPPTSSRFAFGSQFGFILLQPMYSFVLHDIGKDTPLTNWADPKSARDRIRVAYKRSGRPYYIRNTIYYPTVHDIVKPVRDMEDNADNIIQWWKKIK